MHGENHTLLCPADGTDGTSAATALTSALESLLFHLSSHSQGQSARRIAQRTFSAAQGVTWVQSGELLGNNAAIFQQAAAGVGNIGLDGHLLEMKQERHVSTQENTAGCQTQRKNYITPKPGCEGPKSTRLKAQTFTALEGLLLATLS